MGGERLWRLGDPRFPDWTALERLVEDRLIEPGRWYPEPEAAEMERIVRAALAWLDHADAACEQDDELIELAKATRALKELTDG
jgi:hypothetical protein